MYCILCCMIYVATLFCNRMPWVFSRSLFHRCEQENKFLKRELEQFKDRVTSLKQECDVRGDESVRHVQTIDELKRKMSRLQQERDAASRDKTKEVLKPSAYT